MKKFLCLAVFLTACGGDDGGGGGGGGGISDSKQLGSLTQEEGTALCNEIADNYPEKTVSCPDGDTTVGTSPSDCTGGDNTFPSSCTATVGDARDCFDALYNQSESDTCSGTIPAECEPLFSCV